MLFKEMQVPAHDGDCGCFRCRYLAGQKGSVVEAFVVLEIPKRTFAGEEATLERQAFHLDELGLKLARK